MNAVTSPAVHKTSDRFPMIVVPVSNPATTPQLIKLATTLVNRAKGHIIALFVAPLSSGNEKLPLDELEAIIQQFKDNGYPVELRTHPAENIARDILDTAREVGADLLILGVQSARRGTFEIGPVTRGVTDASPCDVLIYATQQNTDFNRVVVPVDGSDHARVATRIAARIGEGLGVLVEAIHIQSSGHTRWEAHRAIERSLMGIDGEDAIQRTVATASDHVSGLLARLDGDDLLVIGFASREVLEKWLFSHFSTRLLNNLPGSIVLTSARVPSSSRIARQFQRGLHWILPTLTEPEQDELAWTAEELSLPNLDYWVLMITSAVIASAGLVLNSPALLIGAMLVAPLKRPITMFSIGLTMGRVDLLRRALMTILLGVLLTATIGFITGKLLAFTAPTEQMLAWSHPTITDAVIALAAGVVGAYATARKDVADTLAGVAIATSLEPAVATIGLSLASNTHEIELGAALLFITNLVCIILAGWAVFFWMGMRPRLIDKSRRRQYISWALVMFMALPIVIILLNLSNRGIATSTVSKRLQEAFAPAEVVEIRMEEGEPLTILATLRTTEPITPQTVQIVQNSLSSQLGEPIALRVIMQAVIAPPTDAPRPASPPPTATAET